MFCAARVLKSRGIKGEVKALPFIFGEESFAKIPFVYIDGKKYHIASQKMTDGFVYLFFDEVITRNDADLLKEKELMVEDRFLPKLPEGRFYVGDLIGCKILLSEEGHESVLGIISDVNNYGSADVISFRGEKKGMFPYLNKVVLKIDLEKKEVTVSGVELDKVCVYED